MARIPLGALTTLNLSTHLDPMFVELYTAYGGNFAHAPSITVGSGSGIALYWANGGSGLGSGSGFVAQRGGSSSAFFGDAGALLGSGEGADTVIYTFGANRQRFYTNGAERVRIDSAGLIGIGRTPVSEILEANRAIAVLGTLQSATGPKLALDHATTTGVSRILSFGHTTGAAGTFEFYQASSNNSVNRTALSINASGNVAPGSDNAQTMGSGALRWSVFYAGTGTINTSDAREKTEVTRLSAAEIDAAKALASEIGAFSFLSAIAAKGADARIHIGMTVQRAMSIMSERGLDPLRYAFICHDEWESNVAPAHVVAPILEMRETGLVGKDGLPILKQVEISPEVQVPAREIFPAGDRYGFRVDQLLLFIARGLEARLTALEQAA